MRVTPGGGVSDFEVPGSPCAGCLAPSLPVALTSGPQGRLWFLDDARNRVGSITTGGVINTFDLPGHNRGLADITAGSDGNLWFIQNGSHTIGRLAPASVGNPSAAIGSAPGPSTTLKTVQPIVAGGTPPGAVSSVEGSTAPARSSDVGGGDVIVAADPAAVTPADESRRAPTADVRSTVEAVSVPAVRATDHIGAQPLLLIVAFVVLAGDGVAVGVLRRRWRWR